MEWLCVIETKREQLIQQLTEEIQTGHFKTATKLPPERVLMEEMGVTRTLLREALMTMEGMGRLSIEGRSGITIIRNGEEKVAQNISGMVQWPSVLNGEILEVRLILEIPAAKIAARVRNDVDLEQIDTTLEVAALCAVLFGATAPHVWMGGEREGSAPDREGYGAASGEGGADGHAPLGSL